MIKIYPSDFNFISHGWKNLMNNWSWSSNFHFYHKYNILTLSSLLLISFSIYEYLLLNFDKITNLFLNCSVGFRGFTAGPNIHRNCLEHQFKLFLEIFIEKPIEYWIGRRKISAHVDGGPSGGSSVRRPAIIYRLYDIL